MTPLLDPRPSTSRVRRLPPPRQGSITVFVLLCLVLITALCGVLLRVGLAERRRQQAEEHRLQAEWLVESGLERAWDKLAAGDDYKGETWDVSALELGGAYAGRVTIAVEAPDGPPGSRRIRVRADFPRDVVTRARVSKSISLKVATAARSEKPER